MNVARERLELERPGLPKLRPEDVGPAWRLQTVHKGKGPGNPRGRSGRSLATRSLRPFRPHQKKK